MEMVVFSVRGMDCASCEERIQRALIQTEGVHRSVADHTAGTVTVVLDPRRSSPAVARAVIQQSGFEVSP